MARPLRVLHLADRLSDRGGADRYLLDLVSWQARRWEVVVAAGSRRRGVVLPPGVRFVRVRGLARQERGGTGLAALRGLLAWADAVHVQNVLQPDAIRRAVDTGRTWVTVQDHRFTCLGPGRTLPDGAPCDRSPGPESCRACLAPAEAARRARRVAARRAALSGARLVVLSAYMARDLASCGLPGARVIPPPVPVTGPPRSGGRGWVVAGRLVRLKAPRLAWEAWRRSGTDEPLWMVGVGKEGELPGVRRCGWLPPANLRHLLARARALVLAPRWQEPFGMVGAEALAVGTPVLGTSVGGIPEWLPAPACLPPHRPEPIAAAMCRLVEDPAGARELALAGQARVRRHCDPVRVRAALDALVRSVAGQVPEEAEPGAG